MTEPMFLIWSLEHDAWWRAGRMGYTRLLGEAGRYSEHDADEIVKRANYDTVNECKVPVRCVEAPMTSAEEFEARR